MKEGLIWTRVSKRFECCLADLAKSDLCIGLMDAYGLRSLSDTRIPDKAGWVNGQEELVVEDSQKPD